MPVLTLLDMNSDLAIILYGETCSFSLWAIGARGSGHVIASGVPQALENIDELFHGHDKCNRGHPSIS